MIFLFPDGVKHRVYNSRSMTDVESRLEVLLLEESDRFVSYSCIGINSQGAAEDRVDIEVIEKQPAVYDSAPQKTEVETRVQLWDTNEGMSIMAIRVVEFSNRGSDFCKLLMLPETLCAGMEILAWFLVEGKYYSHT